MGVLGAFLSLRGEGEECGLAQGKCPDLDDQAVGPGDLGGEQSPATYRS